MNAHNTPDATPPVIALDGPSALALYRDRSAIGEDEEDEGVPDDCDLEESDWLTDEDVAASLAAESAFGHRAFAEEFQEEQEDQEGRGRQELMPLTRSRARQLSGCASRSQDLKRIPYEKLGICPPCQASPLFILVPGRAAKRRVRNVQQRACTHMVPSNSLRWLDNQVLVPSPELTFLLLAQHLSVEELIAVGMELCGRYRMTGATTSDLLHSQSTAYDCDPLTSPRKIAGLIERAESFPGKLKARRACKYVEANSASPMETVLYLLLCLPRHVGGYGLPHPILNAKRAVNEHAGAFTFAHTLVPDLYWPAAMLDMEYDSDEFHANPESLRAGARRTLALRAMNVDVIAMTYDTIIDAEAFHEVARLVTRKLRKRFYKDDTAFQRKREGLRACLLR